MLDAGYCGRCVDHAVASSCCVFKTAKSSSGMARVVKSILRLLNEARTTWKELTHTAFEMTVSVGDICAEYHSVKKSFCCFLAAETG
jgi:hypothetical protein